LFCPGKRPSQAHITQAITPAIKTVQPTPIPSFCFFVNGVRAINIFIIKLE
jgi:hypothetical protein